MELLCCETESVTRAYEDPILLEDSRVFENLLVLEDRYVISSCYFKCLQTEIKPYMRTIIAEWMQEVSFPFLFVHFECFFHSLKHCGTNHCPKL